MYEDQGTDVSLKRKCAVNNNTQTLNLRRVKNRGAVSEKRKTVESWQSGLGADKENLGFITIQFEKVAGKPEFDFLEANTEGVGWESSGGFSGQVELGVISVIMKIDNK